MNEVVILERNNHYWRVDDDGNPLPYLDAVRCNFIIDQKEQLDYFLDDHLDVLLSVPFSEVARLESMLVKNKNPNFKIISTPGIRVEYYGFLLTDEVLGDLRVRRAIYESIDRDFLVDSILLGYGVAADNGFIPPSMPGYHADSVNAWSYNPDEARRLLTEAGYPEAKGFPVLTLQLNDGSNTILQVAEAVQSMITANLGITVELSVLPKDAHYETIEMGNVRFWRDGWIGDYPDPENFLKLFHGKLVPDDNEKASYLNTVRFINEEFDLNFENSLKEPNTDLRMEQFYNADQIIVDQAAVIPLYYENWIWLVKGNVKNVRGNGLGNLDLSTVYFSKPD
jgi:peptide/nickel transport system substrate-binding protein